MLGEVAPGVCGRVFAVVEPVASTSVGALDFVSVGVGRPSQTCGCIGSPRLSGVEVNAVRRKGVFGDCCVI